MPVLDASGRAIKSERTPLQSQIRDTWFQKYRALQARFDAAQTTTDNERHWAFADGLSAADAASPDVRRKLRNRSRYECQENNSYGKGIILKHSNHLVGRGPRLRMQMRERRVNDFIEQGFRAWAAATKLARKLRTMAKAKTVDGEAFGQLVTNNGLRNPIKLDLRLVEAEQVTTPNLTGLKPNEIDGIKYDQYGNPVTYSVLKNHPGSHNFVGINAFEAEPVAARNMLHWFREDRPGQLRGIPETTASLPLFAQLRRFTLATIAAAETAAEYAGVIRSNTSADSEAEPIDPLESIQLEMRSLLTLPEGWDMNQLRPEHPSTTYDMFEQSILKQIAQPMLMPFNVASGDSSKHNFASGRLDHKMYARSVHLERHDFECDELLHLFEAWYAEFSLWAMDSFGVLPRFEELQFTWMWDEFDEAINAKDQAQAEATALASGAATHPALYAEKGMDWRKEFETGAEAYGVTLEEYQELLRQSIFGAAAPQQEENATDGEDDKEEPESEDKDDDAEGDEDT